MVDKFHSFSGYGQYGSRSIHTIPLTFASGGVLGHRPSRRERGAASLAVGKFLASDLGVVAGVSMAVQAVGGPKILAGFVGS